MPYCTANRRAGHVPLLWRSITAPAYTVMVALSWSSARHSWCPAA